MGFSISPAQRPSIQSSLLQSSIWYVTPLQRPIRLPEALAYSLADVRYPPIQNITYAVPQGIIFTRGRKTSLPPRAFDLGTMGYICNFLSPLLVTVIGTFICFPPELPVTTSNMNYTPVILFGLFFIIMCFWFTRGRKFTGPKIDWELLNVTACR